MVSFFFFTVMVIMLLALGAGIALWAQGIAVSGFSVLSGTAVLNEHWEVSQ